ncbi:hypothetical protein ACFO25_00610 [Paenactinomyces guangxiensis]|uniref:Uncharacterized protein n=1 Tax=Paenactinomyces guangxiensis TaxID=1490290 RepID=A0A7W2A999_9BACL|nr:hypothetical protein [Paenactinomyces guangxiensis]MBA4496396.1 hypothetical protein [Paenactinomyces guangxiensis]MBH8593467.1 hypothetical protein [Paenactinomyces guangxiensis]
MLKVSVKGDPHEIYHFMNDLQSQPQYGVQLEAKRYLLPGFNEKEITAYVNYVPKERKPMTVTLKTLEGKEVQINLLDGVAVELDQGITYISGKVFDIFG